MKPNEASAFSSRPAYLPTLTGLRILASLYVFLYHAARIFEWVPAGFAYSAGYLGVSFFFILSGFALAWAHQDRADGAGVFWWQRLARIYPAHLVMCVVAALVPLRALESSTVQMLPSVVLVQAWFPQWPVSFGLNAVSWSLSCEAFFYFLAPFLIAAMNRWSGRRIAVFSGGMARRHGHSRSRDEHSRLGRVGLYPPARA